MASSYQAKHGFPLVIAPEGLSKRAILGICQARLRNSRSVELTTCLAEARKIACARLRSVASPAATGRLTCHVLDTCHGRPAAGMTVSLRYLGRKAGNEASPQVLGDFVTNSDGRLESPVLSGAQLKEGFYEWTFFVGEYFAMLGVPTLGTPFLDEVPIRFGIDNPESNYHVPLLCSPWSFSTYRGS
ncbi:unnamed protein product [Polarella glacialis]|uniref:hydroxyisourate hydrolase n=1 Tax=Polarella glacialis TaxID=89957 RepID=A0A813L4F9_POLGL|nr:unnamed protein product [Polarella glacialis]